MSKNTSKNTRKIYDFIFKFSYFIPGGFGETKYSTYGVTTLNYAMAVNQFNRYCNDIFHGAVTIQIDEIKRCKFHGGFIDKE